jgi:glycerol kinase
MILAIDQGTTATTCVVVDERGSLVARRSLEIRQRFPRPGWVEHDAEEIWQSVRRVAADALEGAGISGRDLQAIGLTNQRETVVAWDPRRGEPLSPALVWQDRRTADRCAQLRDEGWEPAIRERTGLVLDPYFSGTKLEWLLRDGGIGAEAALGTIDSWLVYKLTGRHVSDYSNASRTLLFDLHAKRWDPELCELFHVPVARLPELCASAAVAGMTDEFGGSVPVCALIGDQQAALYAHRARGVTMAKCTYGTGSFILRPLPGLPVVADGLLTTVAWGVGERVDYALESSIFVTGAAVQWLRDGLGVIREAAETERLAAELTSNEGVYFVPALTGLGSPHWDPNARGTIVGLTRGTGRAHLARATLEAIAYQTADSVGALDRATGTPLLELRVDGGPAANAWLMQFQANVLGLPVVVAATAETTALGAAYLAGVAIGAWTEADLDELGEDARMFEPACSDEERERLLAGWRRAVRHTRALAADTDPDL